MTAPSEPTSTSMQPFFLIFTGQAVSLIGSQLVQFSLVWWLTQQTNSANVLAFASIMAILPQAIFSPFTGVLVDRWNRKRVMLIADTVIAVATILLIFLYASGLIQVWHIYVMMFLRSFAGGFHWASMQASTSLMIPKEQMARVAGLNQSIQGIASIVAPPMGALLIEVLPIQSVLSIDVITAMFAIVPLFFVYVPQPEQQLTGTRTILEDMREGFEFILSQRGLAIIVIMVLVINLIVSPGFSLLPLLVTAYFEGGALELAWIQSANGLGMIIGGLLLGVWGGFDSRVKTAFVALIVASVGLLGFSQAPSDLFFFAVVSIFVFGVSNSVGNSSFFAALQILVPPEIQGRVFTLVMAAGFLAQPIGLAIAGPVAEVLGIRSWFLVAGLVMLVMACWAFTKPIVMDLEKN